jgi:hypothetical protein
MLQIERLCRFLGYPVRDGDYRTAGECIQILRLCPHRPDSAATDGQPGGGVNSPSR